MNKELTRLISAMVLGDGSLVKPRSGANAFYAFTQIAEHKDYIDWQINTLSDLTKVSLRFKEKYQDPDGTNHRDKYFLSTRVHPTYTNLYERIYFDRRKSISTHDLELFDWQSAAIWYMDDGYRLGSSGFSTDGNVFLCTDNYNHAEVILLQKVIYNKLNIPFNIRRRGYKKDGTIIYRLVVTRDNAERFLDGVSRYIFPSFEYKLYSERKLSVEETENDIV